MTDGICWIAVDWGSTNLRVYALGYNNQLLDEKRSNKGMSSLSPDTFETTLLELIDDWLPSISMNDSNVLKSNNNQQAMDVIACGMVGARQGWQEAPYQPTPCCPVSIEGAITVMTQDPRIAVKVLSGVSQTNPADVMRGEETQIAGLLAEIESNQASISSVCLPGTHSKWVALTNGKITHFTTYMTGEIFSLLSEQSMLRHTVSTKGWDEGAFLSGVKASVDNPQNLLANCFRLRALDLLENLPAASARSRLSGLVIGAELAGARSFWRGQTVALIGESRLSQLYASALDSVGIASQVFDPKQLTLQGLTKAYQVQAA